MEYITLCLDSTNEVEQWYVRHNYFLYVIFMWDIPVCGEYKLVQIIVNHTQ